MKKFTDWLENEAKGCGILTPPMESHRCINILCDYLLGEDWYSTSGVSCTSQVNTEIVFEILVKYSKEFRKEWKLYNKKRNKR